MIERGIGCGIRFILEKIDNDPEINRLLGKEIDGESGPIGEYIWPSNMVKKVDNGFIINREEFDKAVKGAEENAEEDNNNQKRIDEIQKVEKNKEEIMELIKLKIEELGYSADII